MGGHGWVSCAYGGKKVVPDTPASMTACNLAGTLSIYQRIRPLLCNSPSPTHTAKYNRNASTSAARPPYVALAPPDSTSPQQASIIRLRSGDSAGPFQSLHLVRLAVGFGISTPLMPQSPSIFPRNTDAKTAQERAGSRAKVAESSFALPRACVGKIRLCCTAEGPPPPRSEILNRRSRG